MAKKRTFRLSIIVSNQEWHGGDWSIIVNEEVDGKCKATIITKVLKIHKTKIAEYDNCKIDCQEIW
jgi:hypothetical protein